jgi:hypothetical protein
MGFWLLLLCGQAKLDFDGVFYSNASASRASSAAISA